MKIKDYIGQELLNNINKLTTGEVICIKRSNNHSLVCESINIGHRIKNGQFLVGVTIGGNINIKLSELVNHSTIINIGNSSGGLVCIDRNGTVRTDSTVYAQTIGSSINRTDITTEEVDFINSLINELETKLNTINEINNCKYNSSNYLNKNNNIRTEIVETQQKINRNSQEVSQLQNKIKSFKIDDNITSLSEDKKAHILYKIWNKNDQDSLAIKESIIKQGFNPHYSSNDGSNFLELAIRTNDLNLFKILIDSHLDFSCCIGQNTLFDLVIKSGKQSFVDNMLNSGEGDFAKIIVLNILKNDTDYVTKLLNIVPNWQGLKYKGEFLLYFAISAGKAEIVEAILNQDTSTINSTNSKGYNALELAIMLQKNQEIKLLEPHGVDIKDSLIIRIDQNEADPIIEILNGCGKEYADVIINILLNNSNKEFLNNIIDKCNKLLEYSDAGNNNLVHLCCRHGYSELVKVLLDKNSDLVNQQNITGETPLHTILKNTNEDIQKQLLNVALSYEPNISLLNSQNKSFINLLHDNPMSLACVFELGYEIDKDMNVLTLGQTEDNINNDLLM